MAMALWVRLSVVTGIRHMLAGVMLRFKWDSWPLPLIDGPGIHTVVIITIAAADATGMFGCVIIARSLLVAIRHLFIQPATVVDTDWLARLIFRVTPRSQSIAGTQIIPVEGIPIVGGMPR